MAARSFTQIVASGDERATLVAMRELIATQLELGVPPRDLASLTKRLREVMSEIHELDTAGGDGDAADEVARRRDERRRRAQASG